MKSYLFQSFKKFNWKFDHSDLLLVFMVSTCLLQISPFISTFAWRRTRWGVIKPWQHLFYLSLSEGAPYLVMFLCKTSVVHCPTWTRWIICEFQLIISLVSPFTIGHWKLAAKSSPSDLFHLSPAEIKLQWMTAKCRGEYVFGSVHQPQSACYFFIPQTNRKDS